MLADNHQLLRLWVSYLPLMGMNLSNRQIADELGLTASDVQAMMKPLHRGLVAQATNMELQNGE